MEMNLDIDAYMSKGKKIMQDALDHLQHELVQIRAGKASPAMLQGITVDYYGNPTPLNQASNVSTPDAKTLSIQPWDKSLLSVIEQAIFKANLGLTPMNDGEFIRINIPPLTEERRIMLVKQAKKAGEDAKVSLRNGRHKLLDFVKNEVKNGYPEDMGKRREKEVDKLVQDFYEKVDQMIDLKEKDIMTV